MKKDPLISRLDHSHLQQTEQISINTAFASAHDITMATRQTEYELLAPKEQKKQEEWAQKKMAELGQCPANFKWIRVPGGYNCDAGNHWMTDALVAEGKGGFLVLNTYMGGSYLNAKALENLNKNRQIGFSHGLEKFSRPCYSTSELYPQAVKLTHLFKVAREGKLPQGCEASNGFRPLYLDGKCKSLS
jgi:hypothetical protein